MDDIQLQHKQIQTLVIEIENEIRELKFEVEQARRDKKNRFCNGTVQSSTACFKAGFGKG